MIRIFVDNTELRLLRDTSMTVELSNALFASPDIEGDISFSFTLPVEGNEQALGFAHLAPAAGVRKLPCLVYCHGGLSWKGELVVQKSGHDSLTAALIINPYPEGFAGRKLTGNHDPEVTVSASLSAHDVAWELFLAASVHDPDVKFAPFFNAEGYGSDNEDWGWWGGQNRRKIVNALFFTAAGSLITALNPFSQAHNQVFNTKDSNNEEVDSTYTETNQLAFCPQIRLARVFEIWCRNAGYRLVNHLGGDLNATFLQSQRSLDGTAAQYGAGSGMTIRAEIPTNAIVSGIQAWSGSLAAYDSGSEPYVTGGAVNLPAGGWWEFEIGAEWWMPMPLPVNREKIRVVVCVHNGIRTVQALENGDGVIRKFEIKVAERQSGHFKYIWSTEQRFTENMSVATQTNIRFSIYAVWVKKNGERLATRMDSAGLSATMRLIADNQQPSGFNIFRCGFRIPELLPDVDNASFLKTMLETMGLCYFISGKTRAVELVPYAALRNAKSLDLTAWELTRETEIQTPEDSLRTFRLKPLKDEEYNEDLRLPDVAVKLPDAYENHEHLVLRTKTNTLYRAGTVEGEEESWHEQWEEYSGNPDRMEVGIGSEDNREPAVRIPHQRLFSTGRRNPDTDALTAATPQLMVADFTVSSDLYNPDEKPSDIILTQYRGFRQRSYSASSQYRDVKNEVMLPVWGSEFALKAKGANSLGEKYVKPVLELLGHKTITYKFRLPANMMQPVEDLLRPSELEPSQQTRFLMVRNVKTVPKKITFQIDNDRDDTVLCQIEAVKVY